MSKFEQYNLQKPEVRQLAQVLNELKINLIFFGYELSSDGGKQEAELERFIDFVRVAEISESVEKVKVLYRADPKNQIDQEL